MSWRVVGTHILLYIYLKKNIIYYKAKIHLRSCYFYFYFTSISISLLFIFYFYFYFTSFSKLLLHITIQSISFFSNLDRRDSSRFYFSALERLEILVPKSSDLTFCSSLLGAFGAEHCESGFCVKVSA